jgi:GNAT superfamily N-acetyltransferase
MALKFSLRKATADDIPDMDSVLFDAFEGAVMDERCFPPSEPESHEFYRKWLADKLEDPMSTLLVAVAEDPAGSAPFMAGWVRWVRRPAADMGAPPLVFTAGDFPSCGDGAFAARFFQANFDVWRRVIAAEDHYALSMLVVRKQAQRRGVGAALVHWGIERADAEGWPAYVNASPEGRPVYERFGFRSVDVSDFDGFTTTWHMRRDGARAGPEL